MTRTEDPEDENLIHHPDTTANTTISPATPNCGTGFNGAPALFATPAPPLVQLAGADAVSVAKEQNLSDSQSMQVVQRRLEALEEELNLVRLKGKLISQELDLFRQRRVVFWSDRFRNTFDAWNLMDRGFQQLKDDSAIFCDSIQGYRLQPSLSLLRVPFLTYKVRLTRPGLKAVLLAPVVDVPLTAGEICLRIFSSPANPIATSTVPVSQIHDESPVELNFPAIQDSDQSELTIRVYVQGVDAPVRIFELRRYALGGFGRLSTKPFAGYIFA
jgi:hypothetical protein